MSWTSSTRGHVEVSILQLEYLTEGNICEAESQLVGAVNTELKAVGCEDVNWSELLHDVVQQGVKMLTGLNYFITWSSSV